MMVTIFIVALCSIHVGQCGPHGNNKAIDVPDNNSHLIGLVVHVHYMYKYI